MQEGIFHFLHLSYSSSWLKTGARKLIKGGKLHIQLGIQPGGVPPSRFPLQLKLQLTFSKKHMTDLRGGRHVFELTTHLYFLQLFIARASSDDAPTITKDQLSCTFRCIIVIITNNADSSHLSLHLILYIRSLCKQP